MFLRDFRVLEVQQVIGLIAEKLFDRRHSFPISITSFPKLTIMNVPAGTAVPVHLLGVRAPVQKKDYRVAALCATVNCVVPARCLPRAASVANSSATNR